MGHWSPAAWRSKRASPNTDLRPAVDAEHLQIAQQHPTIGPLPTAVGEIFQHRPGPRVESCASRLPGRSSSVRVPAPTSRTRPSVRTCSSLISITIASMIAPPTVNHCCRLSAPPRNPSKLAHRRIQTTRSGLIRVGTNQAFTFLRKSYYHERACLLWNQHVYAPVLLEVSDHVARHIATSTLHGQRRQDRMVDTSMLSTPEGSAKASQRGVRGLPCGTSSRSTHSFSDRLTPNRNDMAPTCPMHNISQ